MATTARTSSPRTPSRIWRGATVWPALRLGATGGPPDHTAGTGPRPARRAPVEASRQLVVRALSADIDKEELVSRLFWAISPRIPLAGRAQAAARAAPSSR